MKTLELEKLPPELREAAHRAEDGILLLTEKGRPAFAVVGLRDEFALEALALSRNPNFMAYLDSISRDARQGRTYSLREIQAEYSIPSRPRRKGRAARKS